MKHLIYILTLFISTLALSQNRNINIKTYKNGDLSLWYEWRIELCNQIGLDTIQNSKNKWHFRLWTNKQAIDVWENLDGKTYGKITNWTKEYTPNDEEKTERVFFESEKLDSTKVDGLLLLIDSTQINSVPDEDSIAEWEQGFDGITYIIENVNSEEYHFKTYWTPTAQDSLIEAITVQNFVNSTLKAVEAKDKWIDFASKIPFECYINGGPMVACRVLTKKEKRKLKIERKNYRQQRL